MSHQPIRQSRKAKISASVQALASVMLATGEIEPGQLLAVLVFMNTVHMLLISLEKMAASLGINGEVEFVLDTVTDVVEGVQDGLEQDESHGES